VVTLTEEVKKFTEKNNLLKNGRKSDTSSTLPSHDIGRSNKKISVLNPTVKVVASLDTKGIP